MSPLPSACGAALNRRRRACVVAALGLAAGAGLQWVLVSAPEGAVRDAAPGLPELSRAAGGVPTVESLTSLPAADRLADLAAALPDMKAKDLLPLVRSLALAALVQSSVVPVDPFTTPPPDATTPLLRAALARWAEADEAGLLAAMESPEFQYDYGTRRLAVLAVVELRGVTALGPLSQRHPVMARAAVWEMLQRQPQQLDELLPYIQNLQDSMTESPPPELAAALGTERFLRYAVAAGGPELLQNVVIRAATEDFPRALEVTKALPDGPVKDSALGQLLKALDQKDVIAATAATSFRQEYETLPPGSLRDELSYNYAAVLAKEDPDNAVAFARSLRAGAVRSQALTAVAANLPEGTAPATATRLFAEAWLADPESHSARRPSARGISSFPITPTVPFPYGMGNPVGYAFEEWHDASPAEAEAWLQTITQPGLRSELTQVLLTTPGQGRDLSLIPDSTARLHWAEDAVFPDRIAGSFPSTLLADYEAMVRSRVPADMLPLVNLQHALDNNVSDSDWAGATPEERHFLSDAAIRDRKTFGNPQAALDLFNAMAPEERSLGAWYEAAGAHFQVNPDEAAQWAANLPAGAERDAAVTALVEKFVESGPGRNGASAFAWANGMSGETERSRYLAEAVRAWSLDDPGAARTAVTGTAGLTDAERQRLLRLLPE